MTTHCELDGPTRRRAQHERGVPSTSAWLVSCLALFALNAAACGDDPRQASSPQDGTGDVDASAPSEDVSDPTDLATDTTTPEDAALNDATPDAVVEEDASDAEDSAALAPDCQGACREQSLVAARGDLRVPFTFAAYGLTDATLSDSGELEVLVEIYSGGEATCPREDSPTPESTLILSGLADPPSEDQPLTLSLLDFEGALLEGAPIGRAESVSSANVEATLCGECLGEPAPSHNAGFVALDLTATFPEGITLTGHVFAVHCDSLDLHAP